MVAASSEIYPLRPGVIHKEEEEPTLARDAGFMSYNPYPLPLHHGRGPYYSRRRPPGGRRRENRVGDRVGKIVHIGSRTAIILSVRT